MKNHLLILFLIWSASFLNAQAYEGQGDLKLNAGLNAFGNGTGLTGTLDYGLSDLISVGGGTELYFSNNDENSDDNIFIFGRLNFHLGEIVGLNEQWDFYPGINLGVLGDEFGFQAHLGARYFFSDFIGAYVEIGNHGSLGVSFNF